MNDIITGTVKTDAQGSEVNFDICTRAEWEKMTEEQREKATREALFESGVMDYWANDQTPPTT